MYARSPLPPLRAPAVAACALLVCAPLARAQQPIAGSQSHVLFAASVGGGAAASSSASYALDGSLLAAAELASGAQWSFRPATVWSGTSFQPAGPLVFSAFPPEADRVGGASASVIGYGFAAPGAGPLDVALAGVPVTAPFIASNSVALVTVAPGVNAFGNPLGRGDVVVQNAHGGASAVGGFVYTPAVVLDGPVRIGQAAPLRLALPPASFYALAVGGSIPGFTVPVPPLQGALELINPVILVTGVKFSITGQAAFQPPVAADLGLVGVQLEIQAISLTGLDPLVGTFTNRLVVTIQP
ncbi:MAG: hypothetical protein EPO68_03050 [Planctomycetota bacterium]|nr:MAG: hypothetical protein EPO68_03050 [Planctomycetota bacterium]